MSPQPKPGDRWISRAARDDGRIVEVLTEWHGRETRPRCVVYRTEGGVRRGRRQLLGNAPRQFTSVEAFVKRYEPVEEAQARAARTAAEIEEVLTRDARSVTP